jgi:hypothetical protein
MDRRARKRISKLKSRLAKSNLVVHSGADILQMAVKDRWRSDAQYHATAVAAIVRFGKPKIDEPLALAWKRTLLHHDIRIPDACESEVHFASPELYSAIIEGADERERFTEIFRTAPMWLLRFTWIRFDAFVLGFDLPSLSSKPAWGMDGLADAYRWPQLPMRKMTDGRRSSPNSEDDEEWCFALLTFRGLEPYIGSRRVLGGTPTGQRNALARFLEPTFEKLKRNGARFYEVKPKSFHR